MTSEIKDEKYNDAGKIASESIAGRAENFILKNKEELINKLTTTQLRKFLTAVNQLNNKVVVNISCDRGNIADELSEELVDEIQFLRARMAYLVGKAESKNKRAIEILQRHLDAEIKKIGGSKKKYEEFGRMVEAIVAYHRYYGGKD